MIETCITDSAKEDFLKGVHQPGDLYKIALFTDKAELSRLTVLYQPLNESTGIGYTEGGIELVGYSVVNENGESILSFADPIWETVSITARGALIYNSSRSNKAVFSGDFGANITSTNAPFQIILPLATAGLGLIRAS